MKHTFGATSILAASLVMLLTACNDAKPKETPETPAADTQKVAPPATGAPTSKRTGGLPDSLLKPPPPLAAAKDDLAKDTVPLRAPDGGPTRYGIKSGMVVQRYTGNSAGERRIIFDDYGMRERREENIAPNPPGSKGAINNLIHIMTPEENAYADIRSQRGWKRKNEGIGWYLASPQSKTMSLAEYAVRNSGAKRLPDTTISGYQCKVLVKEVEGMTITNWIWRGIVIREHLLSPKDSLEYFIEPIEITPNIDVPDSTFRFPAGYQIDVYTPPPGSEPGTKK